MKPPITVIVRTSEATRERLRKLASIDSRSMSKQLDVIIELEYKRVFGPEFEQEQFDKQAQS